MRPAVRPRRFPRVGGFHRERAVGRAHHQSALGLELDHLVGARERRRPRNWATRSIREPTATGGGVLHSTDFDVGVPLRCPRGSPTNAATIPRGRSIVVSTWTSNAHGDILPRCAARGGGQPGGTSPTTRSTTWLRRAATRPTQASTAATTHPHK